MDRGCQLAQKNDLDGSYGTAFFVLMASQGIHILEAASHKNNPIVEDTALR
jgi:hypothetical protein